MCFPYSVRSSFCSGLWIVAVVLCGARVAHATEVVVKNDSLVDLGTGNVQAGFVAGESASAWLTSPCSGNIVAVQVLWRSVFGDTLPSLEDSISVFNAGTFPTPGAVMTNFGGAPAVLEGPVMTDGPLNEFRFLDENMVFPLRVPITTGQVFVVSFKFLNSTDIFSASVVTDTGCQSGKNSIFAVPGGWLSACAVGITGDFVIRAVVDCGAQPGACCTVGGGCSSMLQADCTAAGGAFNGEGVSCGSITCREACCFLPSGCSNLTVAQCNGATGFHQGPGTTCAGTICFPHGACCSPDGSCANDILDTDCTGAGGTYQGTGSLCANVSCPQPLGACCLQNGNCFDLLNEDCMPIPNSTWLGFGTDCTDANTNGQADDCEPPPPIPTVSQWGTAVLTLLLLAAGTVAYARTFERAPGR